MESIRTGRHCIFELNVHLVFVTKYRKSIFTAPHLELMRKTAGKVCRDFARSFGNWTANAITFIFW